MQSVDLSDHPKEKEPQSAKSEENNGGSSIRYHDTKRFRLRAVGSENEIYERYFKSGISRTISLIQMGIALLILISQVLTLSMLLLPTTTEFWGAGIITSVTTSLAATVTLSAARKATYCKLHTSMALHLVNVLVHSLLEMSLLLGTIPALRRRIYATQLTQRDGFTDLYKANYNYNHYYQDNANGTYLDATPPSPSLNNDVSAELTANTVCLSLAAFMTLGGLLQILMSFFMTVKSGRAICCGRAHLEGKFFEIEAAGREDSGTVIQFGKTGSEKVGEVLKSGISPPPYESGYFPASLTSSKA